MKKIGKTTMKAFVVIINNNNTRSFGFE